MTKTKQRQIVELAISGMSDRDIAAKVGVSETDVMRARGAKPTAATAPAVDEHILRAQVAAQQHTVPEDVGAKSHGQAAVSVSVRPRRIGL
jgi:hypothetical protein